MKNEKVMLIADDMEVNRVILSELFGSEYTIIEAQNGIEALNIIESKEFSIDIILLDIIMPLADGYFVLQRMKNLNLLDKIPVVIITVIDEMDNEVKALDMGAADLVVKPFEPLVVKKRVENIVASYAYKAHLEAENNKKRESDIPLELSKPKYYTILKFLDSTVFEVDFKNDCYTTVFSTFSDLANAPKNGTFSTDFMNFMKDNLMESDSEEIFGWLMSSLENHGKNRSFSTSKTVRFFNSLYNKPHWFSISIIDFDASEDDHFLILFKNENNNVIVQKQLLEAVKQAENYSNDIDRYKSENKNLKEKSEKDLLTNLYNKITTEELIANQIALHPDAIHGLLIIDLDNFKNVNDSHGHMFGDNVLRFLGKEIRTHFRDGDIVGRIGGDEFLVFLNNINDSSIVSKKAEAVIKMFADSTDYDVTVSVGGSVYDSDGKTFEDLYQKADIALYTSKHFGKNQWRMYSEKLTEYISLPSQPRQLNKIEGNVDGGQLYGSIMGDAIINSHSNDEFINIAIDKFARFYGFDHIAVTENRNHSIIYDWHSGISMSKDEFASLLSLRLGIIDRKLSQSEYIAADCENDMLCKELYSDFGIQSLMLMRFSSAENNEYSILIAVCKKKFLSSDELNAGRCLAKTVNMALTKKDLESALTYAKSLNKVSFDMSKNYEYIVDASFYIIKANNLCIKRFGNCTGLKCYEVFRGSDSACEKCPIKKLSKSRKNSYSVLKDGIGKMVLSNAFYFDIGQPEKGYFISAQESIGEVL